MNKNQILICTVLVGCAFLFNNCTKSSFSIATPENGDGDSSGMSDSTYLSGIDKKIAFSTEQIEDAGFVSADTNQTGFIQAGATTLQYKFYRNKAYKCGASGYYTFMVLQKNSLSNLAPQWVYLHGGGVGYCYVDSSSGQKVCNDDSYLDEESADELLGSFKNNALSSTGPKNTVLGHRISDGYRIILGSMCDHDLYAGLGTEFPNNPHWSGTPQTVDGLLATMAATEYAKQNFQNDGRLFVQGTSAGSAGVYHLSMGLLNNGFKVRGAILDSITLGEKRLILDSRMCTPTAKQGQSLSHTPLQVDQNISEKLGVFASNPNLFLESQLEKNGIPYFIIDGASDGYCCGNVGAIPEAVAGGFTNNCKWYYDTYQKILDTNSTSRSRVLVVDGLGHVVSGTEDSKFGTNHQAQMESWFLSLL